MARTYRKVPEWNGFDKDYYDSCRRGHVEHEIDAALGPYDIVWGKKQKRRAKKRNSRKNRLKSQQYIDEHLDEFNL